MTLIASGDDLQVVFDTAPSTFYALAVQADNGVVMEVDLTTTTAALHIDADYENSSSADGTNSVSSTDGLVISAETLMTLESTTGSVLLAGKLTLIAGSGLVLLDSMTTTNAAKPLVIDADFESEGDGTLTVWTGKTVTTNNSDMTITAWDMDMGGSMTVGSKTFSIHGSKVGQTIGIIGLNSAQSRNMQISTAELQRMTASGGIALGKYQGGSISSEDVTAVNSDTLLPMVTLAALGDDKQVIFSGFGSTFYGLAAQADNGVVVEQDIMSDTVSMYLDGDLENSSSEDGTNTVGVTDESLCQLKQFLLLRQAPVVSSLLAR
jgi:hypothetical protein